MLDEHFAPYKIDEKTLAIPCILNRGSMGPAEFTYAILGRIYEPESWINCGLGVGYVPRKDVTILEQPLVNEELKARLAVPIKEERPDMWLVVIISFGTEHVVKVPKPIKAPKLAALSKVASA